LQPLPEISNGFYTWHRANLSTYTDETGNRILIAIGRDATNQKETEEALRASDAKLNRILDRTTACIADFRVYSDRRFIGDYFSPGSVQLWGLTPEEMVADLQPWLSRYEPSDLEASLVDAFDYIFNERPYKFEYRYHHPDGSLRWIQLSLTSYWDEEEGCWRTPTVSIDITERKLAEDALRASESRLNRILDRTAASIAEYRNYRDRHIVADYFSSGSLQLWGFTPEELLADMQPWYSRFDPDDLQTLFEEAFDYIYNERPYKYEYRYYHPDGSTRWIQLNLTSQRDEIEEDCWRTVGISIDVTDRKRAEAALARSETQYRQIVENASDLIGTTTLDGNITYMSPKALDVLGYSASELVGQNFAQVVHPDDVAIAFASISNVIDTGESNVLEYRAIHRDGSLRYIVANISIYQDEDGNLMILGISRDVTERKRLEEELRQSEAKFRLIVENANDTIATITPEGTITYLSPNFLEMLGREASELIGSPFAPLVHPEDLPQCYELIQQAVSGGEPYILKYRILNRDGNYRCFIANTSLFHDENGNPMLLGISRDVTEQERLEEELRQSEAKFRAIVENANDLIYLTNSDGIITYMSPNVYLTLGYTAEEMQGQSFGPLTHPEDLAFIETSFQQVFEGETVIIEARCKHQDGSWRWFGCQVSPFQGSNGELLQLGIARDITDRKQSEEALRRSEQKYRNIFENSYVGIGRTRLSDSIVLDANQRMAEMLGYTHSFELLEKPWEQFCASEEEAQRLTKLLQEQGLINEEVQIRFPNGTLRWLLVSSRVSFDEDCIDFVAADITDRKRLEEDLWQSQQFLNSVIDNIPLGFFAKDARNDFRYVLVNRCAEKFVCFQRDEGIGHNDYELLPKELADFYRQQDQAVMEQRSLVETPEVEIVNPMGDRILSRILKFPLFDDQGNLTHLLCLTDDITERKQREEELRLAKDAAEAANRAKSTFLANMSHELRTPLNVILGFTQLMERENALSDRQRTFITTINRSGEHLLNLINDVLEMSKIEAGRITLNPEAFNLRHLLGTLHDMFRVRAEAKDLTLAFHLPPDLPSTVIADQGKLRQVLINLLSNAVKFTEQGTITLHAEVAAFSHPTLVHFTITDTGIGIAPDEIEQLFQPFVQTTSGIQIKEGTGLGLTISRQFVQLMGGDIQVQSTVGCGSTFTFHIPVTLSPSVITLLPARPRRVLGIAPGQPTYRLLIVDDRADNRNLLTQLLQPFGFETQTASNGQEAIAQWQAWQPHLIWMDMRMPIMDGYEATRQIRALEGKAEGRGQRAEGGRKAGGRGQGAEGGIWGLPTRIIALTASAFEEQRTTILAAGCDDFVRKPFREQVIFEKLNEHLGVQFVYAEQTTDASWAAEEAELLPASFQVMPPEWISALQQAAIAIDGDRLLQLVAEIPSEHSGFANQLRELINRFEFDEILELLGGDRSDT